MNDFVVWDKIRNKFDLMETQSNISFMGSILNNPIRYDVLVGIGFKDINEKKIYADCSVVEFEHKYNQRLKEENEIRTIENFSTQKTEILQGVFTWNSDELRYEIDILNHDFFICLHFVSDMKNFKIIDTIQENKLGLIKHLI